MPVLDHQINNVRYYSGKIKQAKPWHVRHALKIWAAVYAALIVWSQQ
ncbi:hypothetical protein Ga0466249_004747 [Sporomusaceae bacterium BoRhaA]|nr:hypothetical protein [Pelorhabdus rhamnosifermentans]MBU2703602.1 hypothetical protein [Pelorhabdus rhamnosifermentans]